MTDDDSKKPHLRAVPAPETSEEEQAPDVAALSEMMARQILDGLPWAHAFCPHIPTEELPRIAVFLAQEQMTINTQVLPRMADPQGVSDTLTIEFASMRDGAVLGMTAPRQLDQSTSMEEAVRMAMMIALADSPNARAILRMHGYAYKFLFREHKPLVTL